jgi:hypothetical protein
LSPLASAVSGPFPGIVSVFYDKGVVPFVKRYVIYPFPGKRASLVACICKYQNRDFAQTVSLLRSFGHGYT